MGLNQRRMKQIGRVHWLVLVGIAGLIGLVVLLLFGGLGPSAVAGNFMTALAKGDVDRLTAMTYAKQKSPDDIRKQWDFTVHQASPYYRFTWKIMNEHIQGDTEATVKLDVRRYIAQTLHANQVPGYYEHFEIPLTKIDGQWKVRVDAINRDLYPFLPR